MFKRILWILSAFWVAWFVLVILAIRTLSPHQELGVVLTPPIKVNVDGTIPNTAGCVYRYFYGPEFECQLGDGWEVYAFGNTVESIQVWLYPQKKVTLGDLILALGTPTRCYAYGTIHILYWKNAYAYSFDREFTPANNVTVFGYGELGSKSWHGFRSYGC